MTHVTVNEIYNPHWVYKSAIVVALCVTFAVAAFLAGQFHFKHVIQASPIPQALGGYVAVGSYGYNPSPRLAREILTPLEIRQNRHLTGAGFHDEAHSIEPSFVGVWDLRATSNQSLRLASASATSGPRATKALAAMCRYCCKTILGRRARNI